MPNNDTTMKDETQETFAILAEMRRENRPYGISLDRLRSYADRIEAAEEREHLRDATKMAGNAAAMREALEDSLKFWNSISSRTRREENLRLEIAAALSAPARNCDKYSLDDIKKMDRDFGAFCKQFAAKNGGNCSGCPIKPMDNLCCHSTWMLLPAAEGGAE